MYGAKDPGETACGQQKLVQLTAHQPGDTVLSSNKGHLLLYPEWDLVPLGVQRVERVRDHLQQPEWHRLQRAASS